MGELHCFHHKVLLLDHLLLRPRLSLLLLAQGNPLE